MCVCVCGVGVALCCVGGLFFVLFISLQISEESKGNRFHLILPSLSLSVFSFFFSLFLPLLSLRPRQTALSLPQSECRHLPALSLSLSLSSPSPSSLPRFLSQIQHTNTYTHTHTHTHTCTRRICFAVSTVIKESERGLRAILPFYSVPPLLSVAFRSPLIFLSFPLFLCLYRQGINNLIWRVFKFHHSERRDVNLLLSAPSFFLSLSLPFPFFPPYLSNRPSPPSAPLSSPLHPVLAVF